MPKQSGQAGIPVRRAWVFLGRRGRSLRRGVSLFSAWASLAGGQAGNVEREERERARERGKELGPGPCRSAVRWRPPASSSSAKLSNLSDFFSSTLASRTSPTRPRLKTPKCQRSLSSFNVNKHEVRACPIPRFRISPLFLVNQPLDVSRKTRLYVIAGFVQSLQERSSGVTLTVVAPVFLFARPRNCSFFSRRIYINHLITHSICSTTPVATPLHHFG